MLNFMRCFFSFTFIFTLLFSTVLYAQPRPKIGLVLSGGGAKGAAHIGVLKIIEANKIPIDYVVGTSIGAYVGGLYALGYSVDDIEKIMLNIPWDDSYSDLIPRNLLSFEHKELRDLYNIPIRLGITDGQLKSPSGLLLGQSAANLLKLSTDVVPTFDHFDHLAIPYRAIATDLATAKMVVLDKGSITKAMHASAAVPGAVNPVMIDGKLLVDGGIVNNLPIDVVKAMGAEIVIAVDIGAPLLSTDNIKSAFDVIEQLSTILTNNTTLAQKRYISTKDILIRPNIDELSTTDFSMMEKSLELGKQAALLAEQELKKLRVTEIEYARFQQQKMQKSLTWFRPFIQPIISIEYQNNSSVSTSVIKEKLGINVGDIVSKEQLQLALNRVYAIDEFEHVDAEFVNLPQGRELVLITRAKSWGPNYLRLGFNLESDFANGSIVDLDFAYIQNEMTHYGGMWTNKIKLGWESMLASEFYLPLEETQHYFVRSRLQYAHDKWASSKERSEIINKYFLAKAGVGFNYQNDGAVELGFIGEKGKIAFEDGTSTSLDHDSLGGYFSFNFDNLNSMNFPTEGNRISLNLAWRNDNYQESNGLAPKDTSLEIRFDWRGAFHIKNHTFVGIASFATVDNDTDFTVHVTELGGFLNLSGYQKDALIGAHKGFLALVYQYNLGRELFGKTSLPLYLGLSLEEGNVWDINETVSLDGLVHSGSFYLGTDTDFGPAVFGIGFASEGESTVFLSFGKSF
jgi:NTE family protein